jgi:hypothetical protein
VIEILDQVDMEVFFPKWWSFWECSQVMEVRLMATRHRWQWSQTWSHTAEVQWV